MEMLMDWIPERIPPLVIPCYNASALLCLLFFTIYMYFYFKYENVPPGPTGWPFLGYWPYFSRNLFPELQALNKKYGDFYSFSATGSLYISLGSFKAVREAHIGKSDCFGGRFNDFNLLTAVFGDGVGFVNGDPWKVLRKFFLNSFKERGMLSTNDSLAASIHESIAATVKHLKRRRKNEEVNIVDLLTDKCTGILRETLFGEDGVTEKQVRQMNDCYAIMMGCMTSTNMLLTGKLARYFVLPLSPGYLAFQREHNRLKALLAEIIEEHKCTYDEENMRDVIDEFLKEKDDRQDRGDPTAKHFTDKALVDSLIQLVGDGVSSVAAFIALYVTLLLDHPDEQDKIFQEISEVVGLDRLPTVEDKSRLKYTYAFLLEGLRTSNFFPFFPSMQCTKETTIRGHRIPVGAISLMNTWSCHTDPMEYEEPLRFNPSRYLEVEGKKRPELPITFGVGKRACVGEGYAMIQVFLFVAALVQNFRIKMRYETDYSDILELLFAGKLKIIVKPRSQET